MSNWFTFADTFSNLFLFNQVPLNKANLCEMMETLLSLYSGTPFAFKKKYYSQVFQQTLVKAPIVLIVLWAEC